MNINQPLGEQMTNNTQQGQSAQPAQSSYSLDNIQSSAASLATGAAVGATSLRESLSNTVSDFSSKSIGESSNEFLNSNTIVAKFVFLILVLIVFLILMNLGIFLIIYFTSPDKTPYIVKGLINGNSSRTIPQDPKKGNSVTIHRSNNEKEGIEFTWSVWLKRDSIEDSTFQYSHIFSKGNFIPDPNDGSSKMGNAPGVYFETKIGTVTGTGTTTLNSTTNELAIFMETVEPNATSMDTITEKILIEDVPLKRWFHLAIRIQNKIMDVYINGTVAKRVTFSNVPKQNYDDIHVAKNGGFNGQISDLRYFDSALNVFQIMNLVNSGPNLRSNDADKNRDYTYLANTWYM